MIRDEARRNIIRRVMSEPVWAGVDRGVYVVELTTKTGASVEINLEEAVLIRQVDRLLQRVVDENRSAFVAVVGADAPRALVDKAWQLLEQAQSICYVDGRYQVMLDSTKVVSFYLTEWDGALLERYDRLLRKVYRANRHAIDSMLREEAAEQSAALNPLLKAA